MVEWLGVKSLVDVGCGRGISTSWFALHGLDYVVCVEGSHDAVTKSLLPGLKTPSSTQLELVEHDFSRGPWWPSRTVDAAWCVEFTEHVGRNFQKNYHTVFRKAAYIFMTHSHWSGWHHVEVHDNEWWRGRMESMGFVYSEFLTNMFRGKAGDDKRRTDLLKSMEEGKVYDVGQHLRTTLQVFINPLVASLPQHSHLFAEHGCFEGGKTGFECGKKGTKSEGLTALPDDFKPLVLTDDMDKAWFDLVGDL
jgi:cyclopropane fatty-acyl-phospholipid synthase-like methyltransferase